jgi:hypothetical protein
LKLVAEIVPSGMSRLVARVGCKKDTRERDRGAKLLHWKRRWTNRSLERWITCVLGVLAAACLVLAALVWRRLLSG